MIAHLLGVLVVMYFMFSVSKSLLLIITLVRCAGQNGNLDLSNLNKFIGKCLILLFGLIGWSSRRCSLLLPAVVLDEKVDKQNTK